MYVQQHAHLGKLLFSQLQLLTPPVGVTEMYYIEVKLPACSTIQNAFATKREIFFSCNSEERRKKGGNRERKKEEKKLGRLPRPLPSCSSLELEMGAARYQGDDRGTASKYEWYKYEVRNRDIFFIQGDCLELTFSLFCSSVPSAQYYYSQYIYLCFFPGFSRHSGFCFSLFLFVSCHQPACQD